jgi:hypothetical protein
MLDLENGVSTKLTDGANVNVDPRWSPDGKQVAFVSTQDGGRFHVFIGRFDRGEFVSSALLDERKSNIERYYYSPYDHELSPAWLRDGSGILVAANPETPYGTGSLWLHRLDGNGPAELVQREETSWKAQPDIAPDGSRVAYASYLGRQWHQLWVTQIDGMAEPFPLTYGDFDVTQPRWSPDGERIAYVINEDGNTSIRIQEFVGGRTTDLHVGSRQFLRPHATLALKIRDEQGTKVAARVSVRTSDGRSYAPTGRWMHADDSLDKDAGIYEAHYFHTQGNESLTLPVGPATVTVWRGLESRIESRRVEIGVATENELTVTTHSLDLPESASAWQSGDVHVHMNYGGTYRNTPQKLVAQARAEDLDVVFNLIVNKEQRIPDVSYFSPKPDEASTDDVLLAHAQEYHTSHWGHQGLLGLDSHLLIPGYAAYPYTAAASLYPDNATIAKLAREQQALVGYVHPFDPPAPDPAINERLSNALPVDAALDLVDYYEVVGFADPRTSANVWYRLMNCGVRIAAAGGTDAMANYASLRGPVGVNRTYVRPSPADDDPSPRHDAWLRGLKKGHSFATNGPLLGFEVAGMEPGDELRLDSGTQQIQYRGFMRSAVPVKHVEVVLNGVVVASVTPDEKGLGAEIEGRVSIDSSGWLLLRAWSPTSNPLLFDLYPYATTTPIWISVDGQEPTSKADAQFFIDWIDRLRQTAKQHPHYNSDLERARILAHLNQASARFERCNK